MRHSQHDLVPLGGTTRGSNTSLHAAGRGGRSVESAGQDRHTPPPEVLTTGLTRGGGAFGAGGRPLLVKMVVQVPGCGESRAHTLMERRSVWSQRERTDRQTGQRGGQSGEKQPLQESYRGTKTLPQSSVNHEQIRHYFSSSANPGETESSETERQKSWERRVCSQEIKHSGNNDIHPQRPKSAQTPEHHRSDWRLLITLVCLREKKKVLRREEMGKTDSDCRRTSVTKSSPKREKRSFYSSTGF